MHYQKFKKRVFEILEKGKEGDVLTQTFDVLIASLILLNVIAIILESFQDISRAYASYFNLFELFSVIVFTIEYVLRLWTADLKVHSPHKFTSRIKYMFTPLALVDLLAILPFYLPMLIPFDLRFLRMLRLVRIFRLFKMKRYSRSLNIIGKVFKEKKNDLLITIFITFLLLTIASTFMYYIESDVQPDKFSNILQSFWWAIATLTTVGYGDVYPVTGWGKLLSGCIALLGIGLVALPTGIISSGFIQALGDQKEKNTHTICPHCGKKIE